MRTGHLTLKPSKGSSNLIYKSLCPYTVRDATPPGTIIHRIIIHTGNTFTALVEHTSPCDLLNFLNPAKIDARFTYQDNKDFSTAIDLREGCKYISLAQRQIIFNLQKYL